tara:strand:+ start:74 stop:721 length:648 start_codon:yes stop_codon:yes gene_type:complete
MGGFCSGPTPSQKQDIDTGKFSSSQAPKNSALDDLQMDLGMKPKNQVYFRDLEDRQNRAKNAMNNLGKDIFGNPASEDKPAATPEPVVETTTTPVDTTAEEIIETIPDPTQITNMEPLADLEKLDEDIKADPDKAGKGEGLDAPTEPDVGAGTTTALGGEEEAAKLEEIAEGDAEFAVADTIRKGRRSTVQTTPQGLLSSAPTRTRRSLMGKMIA